MSYPNLVWETDLLTTQIRLARDGDDLILLDTSSDTSTVFSDYFGEGWQVQEIRLSDIEGVILRRAEVEATLANGGVVPDRVILEGSGELVGTAYMDILIATEAGTVLRGGGGNDSLYGLTSFDTAGAVFEGGEGYDALLGSAGGDTFRFGRGDGFDVIGDYVGLRDPEALAAFRLDPNAARFQDRIEFGAGIRPEDVTAVRNGWNVDLVIADTGDTIRIQDWYAYDFDAKVEQVAFADGTVWLASDIDHRLGQASPGVTAVGHGTLPGTQYDDTLTADGYGSRLEGGAGNDVLNATVDGGVFDLTLVGGRGNDVMTGSYARDTYVYALGDGHDRIRDDVRSLGSQVAAFFSAHSNTGSYQDQLVFGAGISTADVVGERLGGNLVLHVKGDQGSITVEGWYDGTIHNKIESVAFADGSTWMAADIDARLGVQTGYLTSQFGGGVLEGSQYRDWMVATASGTRIEGGGSNDDMLAARNSGIFDITFVGGRGNDTMQGSYARDVYVYNAGDGRDRIHDDVRQISTDVSNFFYAHSDTASYQDQLVFGAGIATTDVVGERINADLVLHVKGGQGSITVEGWYDGSIFNKIESVLFDDGTTWLASDIDRRLGQWSNGTVQSGSGTITGSQYNDALTATGYGTRLEGGAGNDTLSAGLDGGVFNVSLVGGRGNDMLTGSYGGDTYHYGLGDGSDLIRDDVRSLGQGVADYFYANPNAGSYQDQLVFGPGIGRWDVRPDRVGNDLVLWTNDDQDSITVAGWFDGTMFNKIESFRFDDGSMWLASDLDVMLGEWSNGIVASGSGTVTGSQYNDTLKGTDHGTRLEGGAGNDMLSESSNSVNGLTFVGGRGNDLLTGTYGNDAYHYAVGDGNDLVFDKAGAADELYFGARITPGSVTRARVGQDLVLTVQETGTVTVQDWFGTPMHTIELVGFADGTQWTDAMLSQGLA